MDAPLHDMHCHLNFLANGREVAERLGAKGTLLFANTISPADYTDARTKLAGVANVRVGLGMHPWWVDGSFDADRFTELARGTRFIGEVGLDFGKRGSANRDEQIRTFSQIARVCADQGGKLLSLHAVKSADAVLDMLVESGTLDSCACIFHWYSGPSDQLHRALELGCFVSVNRFMLQMKRGREYVKAIPLSRLLLETDEPPENAADFTAGDLLAALGEVATGVAAIKGAEALASIAETSERMLNV